MNLPSTQAKIYAELCRAANEGRACPTNRRLADVTGLTPSNCFIALKGMGESGVIDLDSDHRRRSIYIPELNRAIVSFRENVSAEGWPVRHNSLTQEESLTLGSQLLNEAIEAMFRERAVA